MSKEKLNIDNAFIELEKQYYNIDMKNTIIVEIQVISDVKFEEGCG